MNDDEKRRVFAFLLAKVERIGKRSRELGIRSRLDGEVTNGLARVCREARMKHKFYECL